MDHRCGLTHRTLSGPQWKVLPLGRIFRSAARSREREHLPYQSLRVGIVIALTLICRSRGVSMITSMADAGSYLRPAQMYPSKTTSAPADALTPADALPAAAADGSTTAGNAKQGIPVSAVKKLDTSGLKVISVKDNPELRDRMATTWLEMQAAKSTFAVDVPDNAPQNIGGFNRSSQHSLYGSLGGIRREFPPVFSSRGFFEAGC